MTSSVTQLTHKVDNAYIARLFMKFKGRYNTLWTSRANSEEEWEFIIQDWHQELSKFSLENTRTAIEKALSIYTDFPPTLGQIVQLCMKASGVPDSREIVRLMTARDFNHPLVKMLFDKLGSWTVNNCTTDDLARKIKEQYNELRAEFLLDTRGAWEALNAFNAKPKELPAPSKIPSTSESKAFKECMSKCQEILKGKGVRSAKTYKHFDEEQIKPSSKNFNPEVYEEYRQYLLSVPETETMTLPPTYAYVRARFLNAIEQPAFLKKAGYNPNPQGQEQNSTKGFNGAFKAGHANWSDRE